MASNKVQKFDRNNGIEHSNDDNDDNDDMEAQVLDNDNSNIAKDYVPADSSEREITKNKDGQVDFKERQRKRKMWIIGGVIFFVSGAILALCLSLLLLDDEERVVDRNHMLKLVPETTKIALNDKTSHQSQALNWLLEDPAVHDYSDERLMQRFALATLFMALNGQRWIRQGHWLSATHHECDWTQTDLVDLSANSTGSDARATLLPVCSGYPVRLYQELHLDGNNLQGSLPPEISLLTSLKKISLADNHLSGSLPTEVGLLFNNLSSLVLSKNNLSGDMLGKLFNNMTQLIELRLDHNSMMTRIPEELGLLGKLQYLSLANNGANGTIPSQLFDLVKLEVLDLSDNNLLGDIPSGLGNLHQIKILHLGKNKFSNTIPASFGRLSNLQQLRLEQNQIPGSLPTVLGRVTDLEELDISLNKLTGTFPTQLSQLRKLKTLVLDSNDLSGTLPLKMGTPQKMCLLSTKYNDQSLHLCALALSR